MPVAVPAGRRQADAVPDSSSLARRAAAPRVARVPDDRTGLTWRALEPAGVAALAVLVAAVEDAAAAPYRTSQDELADRLRADDLTPSSDTLGGWSSDGVLRAWAMVDQPAGDERVVRAFLSGGVDPVWTGRGIGRQVLRWSVDRARQRIAASGKDAPARIGVFTDDTDARTAALVEATGLTPVRYYAEMRRPCDRALPDVVLDRTIGPITLRPWSDDVEEAARVAHNEAFADHWGSEPRTRTQWFEGRSMFAPAWSFVAVDGRDEVVGYLMSGRYEQDWAVAGRSSGYVERLGVRRAWRGRGIAVALLVAAIRAYRADGVQDAELGVDTANPSGAHRLYERLGFEVFHRATLRSIEL